MVVVIFLFFGLLFDLMFTAESSFVFDPNYDNWRRRVDSKSVRTLSQLGASALMFGCIL